MFPIICDNDAKTIISKLQDYLSKGGIIKYIKVVDENDTQIVILVDDKPISHQIADAWWSGYKAALA